jgi:hypothetical protein
LKDKALQIISQPLIISLILTFVLIYFLPDFFTKHQVTHLTSQFYDRHNTTYFEDLNGDLKSEKILYYENVLGKASFEIHDADGYLIDQWNFTSSHASKNWELWFFDANNNGFKEIYMITKRNDSVLLNIEEPFSKDPFSKKDILIEELKNTDEEIFFSTFIYGVSDSDNNRSKEVFISLNTGFHGDPRNAYKYDFHTNKISKSPHLTNQSFINDVIDLDNDGIKEVLLNNYAAGNELDTSFTHRSDYHSWLMVLNDKLQFEFDPIEIKNPFSAIHSMPLRNHEGAYDILTRINSKNAIEEPSKLVLFSNKGELIKEKELEPGTFFIFAKESKNEFVLFNRKSGQIQLFNNQFSELLNFSVPPNGFLYSLDIDEDAYKEWVYIHDDLTSVTIFEEDFQNQVSFNVPSKSTAGLVPAIKYSSEKVKELFFREGNNYHLYSYSSNPWFYLKYVSYGAIFLLIFGFVWLMRKGMQLKLEKQRAIEDQISELQIKTINNQIDPHFVFNAINTISEMTLLDNKIEADDFICKFSDFMRGSLNHSDKIITSLEEEIEFVENFIQLQKIRYSNRFDYSITIDQDVNLGINVPKHLIFSYVENAIKHGLSRSKEQGLLQIQASIQNSKLLLIIEDNGPGIGAGDTPRRDSTGNGLRIMDEMFDLFYKLYKKKIQSKVIELFDQDKNKIGFKVELLISK